MDVFNIIQNKYAVLAEF